MAGEGFDLLERLDGTIYGTYVQYSTDPVETENRWYRSGIENNSCVWVVHIPKLQQLLRLLQLKGKCTTKYQKDGADSLHFG